MPIIANHCGHVIELYIVTYLARGTYYLLKHTWHVAHHVLNLNPQVYIRIYIIVQPLQVVQDSYIWAARKLCVHIISHIRCYRHYSSSKMLFTIHHTVDKTQFKVYTCMWVHMCVCMFTMCKTSKLTMHTHCCIQFWHVH